MATVLERFNHLGLASSKQVLSKAGELVAERWHQKHGEMSGDYIPLGHVFQKEGDQEFYVNSYEDFWVGEMDRIIMDWVNSSSEGLRNG